jgi:hypothetical protein
MSELERKGNRVGEPKPGSTVPRADTWTVRGVQGSHCPLADVYREKVGSLCNALESDESRRQAVEAIRALIETILLEPDGDKLKITLKGDLAGMLSAARDSKRSPDTGDLLVQIKLVAGACNPLNLEFSWAAA